MVVVPGSIHSSRASSSIAKSSSKSANDFIVSPFTVIVDTRESLSWSFTGLHADSDKKYAPILVKIESGTLATGDYSIKGHENQVCVERKSLSDLYSTIGHGLERFRAEHERMLKIVQQGGFACVIIEETMERALASPPSYSKMNPKIIFRTCVAWQVRYRVPWIWTADRALAEITAYRTLSSWWKCFNEERKTSA
jgi:ERCC4-type nuclease